MSTSPERRTQTLLEALRSQPSVGLSLENAIDEDSRFAANSSPPALHEPRSPDQETSAVANLESHADQTPTPESSIDLRLLEYVSTIDNNLTCAICRCPFIDPVRLACDHIFCQQCVDEALRNQPRDARNCPSCRSPTSSHLFQPVPRAIKHMVDELLVECPHHEDGCDHVTSRGDIVSHVRKYCGYTEVECPDAACQMKVRRKDIERGCLHQMANCDDCGKNLMRNELEVHVSKCPMRRVSCPHCHDQMVHQDLQAHLAECAEVTFPCSGAPCGCSFVSKREELAEHSATCALAALAPAFNAQKARLDRQEIALKDLWRRNEILEGGFSSIQAILGGSGNETDAALLPSTSSAVLPGLPGTDSSAAESQSQPFDSAMHHLLSLYESLREEVDRVSAAVSELDAKSSVMLMNESLRTKEDLAHTNAALNSMRMQLHWLMSARLQTQPRTAAAAAAAGVAGPSNRPRGGGGDGGPNLPTRRLSDSNRQETKL